MTALPMLVIVTDDVIPPYEQLRRQLTDLIRSQALGPGKRLPPLRQLANDLGLAVGTVARTYRELEAAGLVHSRRGGGTRVVDTPPTLSDDQRRKLLGEHADTYVRQAHLLGVDHEAVVDAVQQALTASRTQSAPSLEVPAGL